MNLKSSLSLGSLLLLAALPQASVGAPKPAKPNGKTLFASGKELFDTQDGEGNVHRKGHKSTSLTAVIIELMGDHRANVELFGKDFYQLSGTWKLVGHNLFKVTFNHGEGQVRGTMAKGTGTVTTRQNRLYKLKIQGVFGGDNLTANFIVKKPRR